MKADIRAKWVDALRNGDYKQGKDFLQSDSGFCCLGVLCDIAKEETGGEWSKDGLSEYENRNGVVAFHGATATLPPLVREWAGLQTDDPHVGWGEQGGTRRVSFINDFDATDFDTIADLIEKHL